jgi:cytochrome c5
MTTPDDALLPCPFCASAAIDAQGWSIPSSPGPTCDDCGASAGCVGASASENIAAWNRRAGQAHTDALLEALEGLLAKVECGTALDCKLCDAARAAIAAAKGAKP